MKVVKAALAGLLLIVSSGVVGAARDVDAANDYLTTQGLANGRMWRAWPAMDRVFYVGGISEGKLLGHLQSGEDGPAMDAYFPKHKVSNQELAEEINKIYSEPANR